MTSAVLILALLAGVALSLGFLRLDALQREFLAANFDSVHGARTLLKARHFVALALASLERAADGAEREHLDRAAEMLVLAENYGAEGNDANPEPRRQLTLRLQGLRERLTASPPADLAALTQETRDLAADFEVAELDRWGTLSSLNSELARRMGDLRGMISVLLGGLFVVIGLLGRALIVTREAESQLRLAKGEIEATQQTTLDASPIGILYVDAANPRTCRIVRANRRTSEYLGAPPDRIIGRALFNLIEAGDDGVGTGRTIAARLAAGEVVQHEFRVRRSDGTTFWCEFAGKAIDPSDPDRGVVWTLEDIDARKQSEERLREAREQAEAANRAKSEFLANMSHEIRTPFTAILGVLDTLLRSPLDEGQRHFAQLGQSSARQLLAIINDILDLSKIEAGKLVITPTAIDLRAIVKDLAALHAAAAEAKGIGFSVRLPDVLPPTLYADGVRLRQVIDNLLGNAVKFTPQGEVTLTVQGRPAADSDWHLRIEVSDSGIGIAPELHAHVFEKFTQADGSTTRLFGGTGLGLAICRQLVTQMGGRIGVDSTPGRGSTFWLEVDFPTAGEGGALPQLAEAMPSELPDLAGLRVLLAEDSAANATILGAQIRSAGGELRIAVNGRDAVELVRHWRPDVVLLDCQMPELDGYAAAQQIRADEDGAARTPIIALTAHASEENRARCLASGMDAFLTKPVDLPTLLCTLKASAMPPQARCAKAVRERFDGCILLVDDTPLVREASRGILESFGLEVCVAESGEQALAHCERDDLDLVLLDLRMPGLDGFATAQAWRQRENGRSRTAIIAVSAEFSADDRARLRAAGMDDFLPKPYDADDLCALLHRWLGPAQ